MANSKRVGNYRIERITGGVAVYRGDQSGIANAIRIFSTTDAARAWVNAR